MSALKDRIVAYVDDQLRAMFAAPEMWGSNESVELQALQLLQFRSFTIRPDLEEREPRTVLDAYHRFLREEFPTAPPHPLFCLVDEAGRQNEFITLLRAFSARLSREMLPDNIFAEHDLVLRLWMHQSVSVPRASTLSSYYESVTRVLRAVSRRTGTRGRASRELEDAIDFSMPDVIVAAANGSPAHITLPLNQAPSPQSQDVQRGLEQIVLVNEWAANPSAPVETLFKRLPDKDTPERVAALAMRLVPGQEESIQSVEMGGRLLGRLQPIVIQPRYAERMARVVRRSPTRQDFDKVGTVRAIDIDQRSMRIKADALSYKCFFEDHELFERAREALGRRARVAGSLYETSESPRVVWVERFDP